MTFGTHKIQENSAFFQGHIGQFFSKNKFSFEIISNSEDRNRTEQINTAKYKPLFLRTINTFISKRKNEGFEADLVSAENLSIQGIRFVDNERDEGVSGFYRFSPQAGICKKENCNQYFIMGEDRRCGHSANDEWEQITFLAYCDVCGRHVPMHLMTNINHDCPTCKEKNSLRRLKWGKKDELSSYWVECVNPKCHYKTGLYFYKCDHTIRNPEQILSTKPKKGFKGVPARAQTIVHPYVLSIPDIPQDFEIDSSGRRNREGKYFSEAFGKLFSSDVEESFFFIPEFREMIQNDDSFWALSRIEDECEELDLDISNRNNWTIKELLRLIRSIIKEVHSKISEGGKSDLLRSRYGIDKIADALLKVKDIGIDENDLQGMFLLTPGGGTEGGKLTPLKKEKPASAPENYAEWQQKYGLQQVIHIANFNMIQALLGTITGSTRRDPLLFDLIMTGDRKNKIPTVFVRDFLTEGVVFQLDFNKILYWLEQNRVSIGIDPALKILPIRGSAENHFRSIITQHEECLQAVAVLLHTYCHMLIQQSTIDTGLDIQSLAERIYPKSAAFFIYSTSGVNIGGLEFTYDYHLEDWFKRMYEIASDCPQDPACLIDEGGSCNACSYVPEFVCERFNQDLDRSTLIGEARFGVGYLNNLALEP